MSDTPFLSAQAAVSEACGWLTEMLLPEGHESRECVHNEESWEQAQSLLLRGIEFLDLRGRDQVEDGGQEVPDCQSLPPSSRLEGAC